ncbi:hypothetical protein ES703_08031 [subsurface metagenome]|jgi:AAA+ superfamily predicted ATPase
MLVIMDVDLIAQERVEFGYSSGSAPLTLLSVLDGVEGRNGVITIATTNCQETLVNKESECRKRSGATRFRAAPGSTQSYW